MAILAVKVFSLIAKTLTKPLAKRIVVFADKHQSVKRICNQAGQLRHRAITRMEVRLLGHKIKEIKPLDESIAITDGADLIGEGLIFSVAITLLLAEYTRSEGVKARARAKSRAEHDAEMKAIQTHFSDIETQVAILNVEHNETRRLISQAIASLADQIEMSKDSRITNI
eukprot:873219_1